MASASDDVISFWMRLQAGWGLHRDDCLVSQPVPLARRDTSHDAGREP